MDSIVLWGPWEVWGILVLVTLATYLWRAGGVAIAQSIKNEGEM